MRGKIGALVAAVAAAASAAGAATLAKRRRGGAEPSARPGSAPGAGATAPSAGSTVAAANGDGESVGVTTAAAEAPTPRKPTVATESLQPPAADDLTAIKGLGKVKVAKLAGMGITTYAQIAAWTDDDIAQVGLAVNTSPGQIKREDWVGQAKALVQD